MTMDGLFPCVWSLVKTKAKDIFQVGEKSGKNIKCISDAHSFLFTKTQVLIISSSCKSVTLNTKCKCIFFRKKWKFKSEHN